MLRYTALQKAFSNINLHYSTFIHSNDLISNVLLGGTDEWEANSTSSYASQMIASEILSVSERKLETYIACFLFEVTVVVMVTRNESGSEKLNASVNDDVNEMVT
jgi:hypothetical protein